ncbi:MAG: efflux RND transporter periplasmic adaptor subunit [Desulfovibrionaceae bacterium]|nr:efflux RND transporter periplasmic adaptor subunit [Desulfovibrionaceae bacterium]
MKILDDISRIPRRTRILGAAGLALVVLAALVLAHAGGTKEPEAQASVPAKSVRVTVEKVAPAIIRDVLTLPGQTEAAHDVTLSAERGGRVEYVGFTEGDRVQKGQLIAKIDLTALDAGLGRAEASYDLAKVQAERRASLMDSNVLSREELDKAQTEYKLARNNLREARVNRRQGAVVSPIDAVVNDLLVDPGEYVKPGDPVVELVDVARMRVNVNVPEMDVRHLAKGAAVKVTVDAWPKRSWEGVIDFVAYKADPVTKTFKVRVLVDNSDLCIRPGMLARASFLRRSLTDALTTPLFAVQDRGGERVVFVVEDEHARARTVVPGVIDGDRVQILEGLRIGDRVIVTGQDNVEDGTRVSAE